MFMDKVQIYCEGDCFKLVPDVQEATIYNLVEVDGNYAIEEVL